MPRLRSFVMGFASPNLPSGASQTLRMPSFGARKEMKCPAGLNRACARTGVPNSAVRWMRGVSRWVAATTLPPQMTSNETSASSQRVLTTIPGSSIQERRLTLGNPGALVGLCQRIEVGRCRPRIVDPTSQQVAAVDHIDGESVLFVLVREVAPDGVVGLQSSQRLECKRE